MALGVLARARRLSIFACTLLPLACALTATKPEDHVLMMNKPEPEARNKFEAQVKAACPQALL